jgi:hypothetical protein
MIFLSCRGARVARPCRDPLVGLAVGRRAMLDTLGRPTPGSAAAAPRQRIRSARVPTPTATAESPPEPA